jgi:anti-sigma factor RsiW
VTDCINTEVRDALPDLLHGRLNALDTATMNAHVESCAECRAELALLREARAAAPMAPSIDYAGMAQTIPAYRGAAISAPGRGFVRNNLRSIGLVAAGALIAFTGWSVSRSTLDDGAAVPSVAVVAPSPTASPITPSTAAPSTQTVAKSGNEATKKVTQVASLSLVGSTQDLSDADLEQLTHDLDQLDALPSAEPQSVTLSVEDIGTDQ